MKRHGFSLVETLVATMLLAVVVGAVFAVANPLHGVAQAQPEAADQQQRLRVALSSVATALRNAGAGSLVGAARGPLNRALPPILPYRIGESAPDPPSLRFRRDLISIVSTPRTAAQATLHAGAARGATMLSLTWPGSCPPATAATTCGFGSGTRVLIFDGRGRWDMATVTAAYGTTLEISRAGGLSYDFEAGSIVTEVQLRVFSLRQDTATSSQLLQYDGFQSELPVVDNVVSLAFEYFGEPQAPRRLEAVPFDAPFGPWTTYGPRPPAADEDAFDDSWPSGESCLFAVAGTSHLPRIPDLSPGRELLRLDKGVLTDGPWCPDAASPNAYDADLLRIRRVRVRARIQVASAALRGAPGARFSHGGLSTSAQRFVPDLEIAVDVAPPNLAAGR